MSFKSASTIQTQFNKICPLTYQRSHLTSSVAGSYFFHDNLRLDTSTVLTMQKLKSTIDLSATIDATADAAFSGVIIYIYIYMLG